MRLILSITLLISSIMAAHSTEDESPAAIGQTVRLKHVTIGCGSFEALKRISNSLSDQTGKVTGDQLNAEDCRLLSTPHNEVTDAKDGAFCILGPGNSRCLWLPAAATEPARRY